MISHHYLGTGRATAELGRAARDPDGLLDRIADLVDATRMATVSRLAVPFAGGGITLVWVLAESHLVLHYWPEENAATVDLHVCDYQRSNADRARRLVERLRELLFASGSDRWQELTVDAGVPRQVATG